MIERELARVAPAVIGPMAVHTGHRPGLGPAPIPEELLAEGDLGRREWILRRDGREPCRQPQGELQRVQGPLRTEGRHVPHQDHPPGDKPCEDATTFLQRLAAMTRLPRDTLGGKAPVYGPQKMSHGCSPAPRDAARHRNTAVAPLPVVVNCVLPSCAPLRRADRAGTEVAASTRARSSGGGIRPGGRVKRGVCTS